MGRKKLVKVTPRPAADDNLIMDLAGLWLLDLANGGNVGSRRASLGGRPPHQ